MLGLALDIWRPVYSGASVPAGGIITANRALWLRKGTAAGASWPDASGNSRNLGLIGAPTIGASSVTFNGTTQFGTVAFTIGSPCSIYLRVKQVSHTIGRYLCAGVNANTNHIHQIASSPAIEGNDSSFTDVYGGLTTAAIGTTVSVCVVFTGGANGFFGINGAGFNLDFPTGDAAAGGFTLAAGSSAGVSPSNIEVVEVVLYSVAHDITQRAQMIAYLDTL